MSVIYGQLAPQPWMIDADTVAVMTMLNDSQAETRFVGGCVRNALINRKVIDIDLATTLLPEQVIDRLTAQKIQAVPTGLTHGTVTAVVRGKPFEITTLRRDVATTGRHATVMFTDDWAVDAQRRDFTINTLSATVAGQVFDYTGGLSDLHQGRVIFVGDPDQRIAEDSLRILRFYRMHAHYGRGSLNASARAACHRAAPQLARLSGERIRHEILRMFESPQVGIVWRAMRDDGVAAHVLPEATAVDRLDAMLRLESAVAMPDDPLRRLAAVLDVTLSGLQSLAEMLRLSNAERERLKRLLFPAETVRVEDQPPQLRRAVYKLGSDDVRSLLLLEAARHDRAAPVTLLEQAAAWRAPVFPVTGRDVLNLGVTEGARVGQILTALEDWWIDGDFTATRAACLEKLRLLIL